MLGQTMMMYDGSLLDKVQVAIRRLQMFEPPEGYFVAFSGGKDSQCVYHLCKMAGVKFDAHYSVTTVDPPELIEFIKKNYPDAWEGRIIKRDKDGRPITMWNLIVKHRIPPTRVARYCCEHLKESSGQGRVTVTGVRWAESHNRRQNQGIVTIASAGKKAKRAIKNIGADIDETKRGGVVMNDDNDAARRAVEHCYRTSKTLVNPIIDWEDEDVWEFLNMNGIPHCCLYDQGNKRLGCIACPMQHGKKMRLDLERWPKYKRAYLMAFNRMLEARKKDGLETARWETAQDVLEWWTER